MRLPGAPAWWVGLAREAGRAPVLSADAIERSRHQAGGAGQRVSLIVPPGDWFPTPSGTGTSLSE